MLGESKIVSSEVVTDAAQVITVLQRICREHGQDPGAFYVMDRATGNPARMAVRQNTLTDGSETFDVLFG